MKNKGQRSLCKEIGPKGANPLVALKRPSKGPNGQPKNSVTTKRMEIDAIIREACGKIYVGNSEDGEKLEKLYFDNYGEFVFKTQAAEAEPLQAEDLEKAAAESADSAAGDDQWGPADV